MLQNEIGQTLKKRSEYLEARNEALENGEIEVDDLVFLDESGFKLGQTPEFARAEGGARAISAEPKNMGKNITLIAAMSVVGVIAAMYCTCTLNGEGFLTFIESFLLPALTAGQILIMDNVSFHKMSSAIELIKKAGVRVVFLPPYSPELNPIENMWSKLKAYIKKQRVKTFEQFEMCLKDGFNKITEHDCESWFEHCGYAL